MNYYVIVVMMTFFVIITHKDIKNIDLGLKALFLRVVLSLFRRGCYLSAGDVTWLGELPDAVQQGSELQLIWAATDLYQR